MTSFLELLPGYKKSTLTSVMPHGLVHESEEKLRPHFLHTGTPSATGLRAGRAASADQFGALNAAADNVTGAAARRRSLGYSFVLF